MSEKKTIRYKVGDCIAAENGIGKIVGLVDEDGEVFKKVFLIDFILLAKDISVYAGDLLLGGVCRQYLYIPPLRVSRDFLPASETDWAKAVVLMKTCETSFKTVLAKYNSVTS